MTPEQKLNLIYKVYQHIKTNLKISVCDKNGITIKDCYTYLLNLGDVCEDIVDIMDNDQSADQLLDQELDQQWDQLKYQLIDQHLDHQSNLKSDLKKYLNASQNY